ncbi:MAG: M48 family metalloprotease [Thermodesulfobacteriota bacterium]|jgi:Zn-dependent protease with chaperone function
MKFMGADIRITDIPKETVVKLVKEFIGSNQLRIIEEDEINANITHIRVFNRTDSYFKLWWKGTPQVIDWTILELEDQRTRIETRFGAHAKYRLWFWSICVALATLFSIRYEIYTRLLTVNTSEQLLRTMSQGVSNNFIIILLLVAMLVLLVRYGTTSTDLFSRQLWKSLHAGTPDSEMIVQNNYSSPQPIEILIFVLAGLVAFLAKYGHMKMSISRFTISAAVLFLTILTFLLLAYFALRNSDFSNRLIFILISLGLTISLMLFYSLPYISPLGRSYNRYVEFAEIQPKDNSEGNLKSNVNVNNVKNAIRGFLFFLSTGTWMMILPAAVGLGLTARAATEVKRWKEDFFYRRKWTSLQRGIVGLKGFKKRFSHIVFFFWIVTSATLYVMIYTVLSISEFCILNKSFLFHMNISERYFNETKAVVGVVLTPLTSRPVADFLARVILFAYCVPLLWLLYRVLNKRIKGYFRNLKERKQFILHEMDDHLNLYKIAREIAEDCGVATPDIVVTPSKIPIMRAEYIGFPHFHSYVLLSEGCLNRKKEELIGLLAHEIYHIKRHNFKWYALNLLSDYTVFGSGFLAATINSHQLELDADRYATEWVKERGAVSDYINGLQIMYVGGSVNRDGTGLSLTGSHHGNADEGEKKQESVLRRLKGNMGTVFELYFGETILSYIHPSLEERIEKIRAIGESSDLE